MLYGITSFHLPQDRASCLPFILYKQINSEFMRKDLFWEQDEDPITLKYELQRLVGVVLTWGFFWPVFTQSSKLDNR